MTERPSDMTEPPSESCPPVDESGSTAQQPYALALLYLPGAGPAGLGAALAGRTPREAWAAVCDGTIVRPAPRAARLGAPDQLPLEAPPGYGPRVGADGSPHRSSGGSWRDFAQRCDPVALWRDVAARGIDVTWCGDSRYPQRLLEDPVGPPILTWRGTLGCLGGPTVAIVGTRHCTPAGRTTAQEMGRDLAAAGVCVVSGLALGIDGAAQRGALSAPGSGPLTAGVAASGVDVVYPRQHRELWEEVVARGVVVSETAPGRPAQAWRFPARNRIIAGLADMVVVVESFEAGGSMLTVEAALARGVDVRAVPGPVRSPASSGTNRLLFDGAAPARHAGDVLEALGLARSIPASAGLPSAGGRPSLATPRGGRPVHLAGVEDQLSALELRVLDAVGWAPTLLGRIVERSGSSLGAVSAALARLEEAQRVTAGGSWWVRR